MHLRVRFLILALCMLILVSGCGVTAQSESGTEPDTVARNIQNAPERQADLTGKVKNILGNEITLALIEMPEMKMPTEGAAVDYTSTVDKEQMKAQYENMSNAEIQQMKAQYENMSEAEKQQMKEKMSGNMGGKKGVLNSPKELQYTGDEVSLIIPVGIPVASGGKNSAGIGDAELDFADINKGNILRIWYKDGETGEGAVVEYVSLLSLTGGSM